MPIRAMAECVVPTPVFSPTPQAAVSLRGMLGQAQDAASRTARFRPMGTLSRLDGYVIDRQNKDIVLWGQADAAAPPLMFDDFLVGLRAAYDQYTVIENGKRVLYSPGISIDVDPRVFKALGDADPNDAAAYSALCQQPMTLRVDGMPRHTRVSDILLAADYKMKLVVQGKADIPIDLFFGSMNRLNERYRQLAAERGITLPDNGDMTRWWFRAGAFSYQRAATGDTAFLDRAQVILSVTHERIVNFKQVDANVENTAEDKYACEWSGRMDETYAADPLWREMNNVFRHFALGRLINTERALEASGMDMAPLLTGVQIARVTIPDTVPGSALVEESISDSGTRYRNWHCGGVSLDIDGDTLMPSVDSDPAVARAAGQAVLDNRPSGRPAVWTIA